MSEQTGQPYGFLDGSLDRRLRRSSNFDRNHGSAEERLIEQIAETLAFGEQAAGFGHRETPPQQSSPTVADEVRFQKAAVREMVSAFGGNTHGLRADERRRRRAELDEMYANRLREEHEVQHDYGDADAAAAWMVEQVTAQFADDDEDDSLLDDAEDDALGETAWR